jgi:hypothetical protein
VAETTLVNAKIPVVTKAKLLTFCSERHHSQGEVVAAALEAYFAPVDTDGEALLFQKVNAIEQGLQDMARVLGQKQTGLDEGMQGVVALLGTVIEHLEKQAKLAPVKVSKATELYPALYAEGVPDLSEGTPEGEPEATPDGARGSPWRRLFGKRSLA